jgi:DNA-binding MarR family transcriptional regulator
MMVAERDRELLALIVELGRAARGLQRDEVFCEGVSFTQFYILDLVEKAHRLPLARLHAILTIERSTTTRLVAPLIERGLVLQEACCGDARARELVLTRQGREVLERLWACVGGIIQRLGAAIPEPEREQVFASVRRFLAALRDACGPGCC